MQGLSLRGVGEVNGEEDTGHHHDGISVTKSESEGDDSEQCIWCEGLSCLSRSSNHTNQRNQINSKDPMNQIPAARGEMFAGPGPHSSSGLI